MKNDSSSINKVIYGWESPIKNKFWVASEICESTSFQLLEPKERSFLDEMLISNVKLFYTISNENYYTDAF